MKCEKEGVKKPHICYFLFTRLWLTEEMTFSHMNLECFTPFSARLYTGPTRSLVATELTPLIILINTVSVFYV